MRASEKQYSEEQLTTNQTYPQSAGAVRATIRPERRSKGTWLPLLIFLLNYSVYIFSFIGIVAVPFWTVKIVLIIINGHVIGTLFTVGHDACHGSYTRYGALNGLLGRLAFMPSLTPFTPWRYSHNYLHHSFTNCKDKDFVWRPLSLEEYESLPWFLRLLERTYRSVIGLPLNWIIENWLKWHLLPNQKHRIEMRKWGTVDADRLLVVSWLVLELVAVGLLNWVFNRPALFVDGVVGTLLYATQAILVPFLIWSTLISYVDLLHHTHPTIRWYSSSNEPAFSDTHLEGTTRIVYPYPLGLIYHNIMEHTAHHVDPAIPLYHLKEAQNDLVAEHPGRIVIEFFSLPYLLRILRTCRLYDYANHRWLGFDGIPTTPVIEPKS